MKAELQDRAFSLMEKDPQHRTQLADPLRARSQSHCFVCGPDHPRGLRIRYQLSQDGTITADWIPERDWQGFEGIIHGGIISTVLDEAMSKAVAASRVEALTGELRIRYHHHVEPDERLRILGWIVDRRKHLITTEASLADMNGTERAHAWASFLLLSGSRLRS